MTMDEIEHRVCQAASTLPEYETTNPTNMTCTNPVVPIVLDNPRDPAKTRDPAKDCSRSPVPTGERPCTLHVSAAYSFRPFFGGIGLGIVSFPSSVPISRQAYFVVNDFPTP
jgi:hypothetical protein